MCTCGESVFVFVLELVFFNFLEFVSPRVCICIRKESVFVVYVCVYI